jgi:hypothetical protein
MKVFALRSLCAFAIWFLLANVGCRSCVVYGIEAGGPSTSKAVVTIHMPPEMHLRNKPGSDGSGLCVFTSLEMSAWWQNCESLKGFRDWMTKIPGGGWPEKVDQLLPKYAKSNGGKVPNYIQHTGGDPEFLRAALRGGRYPAVTYAGNDGVFYKRQIAHMVNLAHFDNGFAAIQDNNNPGQWLWMTEKEFVERWKANRGGWAVVLCNPPPPPIPVNATGDGDLAAEAAMSGVDSERLPEPSRHRFTKNGRECTRDEAMAAVQLPGDDAFYRLTIVGAKEFRNRVLADLAAEPLATIAKKLVVQDYEPNDKCLKCVNFQQGITLQPPPRSDGKAPVIWRIRENEYQGAAQLVEALRVADPLYNPDKDPDGKKPPEPKPDPVAPATPTNTHSLGVIIVGLLAAIAGGMRLQQRSLAT